MKKLFTAFALVALVSVATVNQASAQFGVQAGVMMPQGDISEWGMGFGGQVFYKKEAGDGMNIGGTVGYYALGDGDNTTYSIAILPIMATFDYALGDSFYVGADAGYSYVTVTGGGVGAVGSTVAAAPKAGANLGPIHVEVKYQLLDLSYLQAVVGFSF